MPELPEVETTRLGVLPHVVNRTLTATQVRNPNLRWPVELPDHLVGQAIQEVERRAKYLLFRFPTGSLIVHLGMSGSLRVVTPADQPKKHDHIDLVFNDTDAVKTEFVSAQRELQFLFVNLGICYLAFAPATT